MMRNAHQSSLVYLKSSSRVLHRDINGNLKRSLPLGIVPVKPKYYQTAWNCYHGIVLHFIIYFFILKDVITVLGNNVDCL
jgi:hypothetical protein